MTQLDRQRRRLRPATARAIDPPRRRWSIPSAPIIGVHNGHRRRAEWLSASIISGAVAASAVTAVVLVIYPPLYATGIVGSIDIPATVATLGAAGLLEALLYAALVEPAFDAPGWRKGAVFCLGVWAIALGFRLGLGLVINATGAIATLILQLVFGATLGQIYASDRYLTESGEPGSSTEARALTRSQRAMVVSLPAGAALGAVAGTIVSPTIAPAAPFPIAVTVATVFGAAIGLLIGAFYGLTPSAEETTQSSTTPTAIDRPSDERRASDGDGEPPA